MAKRGRKSSADLTTVPPVEALPQRPEPPARLSTGAAQLWRDVVSCYKPDHFAPQDLPLLASFCEHAVQLEQLDKQIADDGPWLKATEARPAGVHPAINARATLIKGIAVLATKLRLPPNARFRRDGQGSEPAPAPTKHKRPWE